MIIIIILVFMVSLYMMIAGRMKQDRSAIYWGRVLCIATSFMLLTLWLVKYR